MTTRPPITDDATSGATPSCAAFEARLAEWLEGSLEDAERSAMERHRAACAACATLVADLDGLVHDAAALPALTPSRDLWAGIESRLEAPVIALTPRHRVEVLPPAPAVRADRQGRTVPVRWFAMAAALLVAVSSGVTWRIARAPLAGPAAATVATTSSDVAPAAPAPAAPSAPAVVADMPDAQATAPTGPADAPVVATSRRAAPTRLASNDDAAMSSDVGLVYEREIVALRRIVDERFRELDSATVTELRRNLAVIDQAIADSRRALQRDPRSGLLSTQLDRTLEAKLDLLRRVALL